MSICVKPMAQVSTFKLLPRGTAEGVKMGSDTCSPSDPEDWGSEGKY